MSDKTYVLYNDRKMMKYDYSRGKCIDLDSFGECGYFLPTITLNIIHDFAKSE